MQNLEVTTAEDAVASVKERGLAIWRGLVAPRVCEQMLIPVTRHAPYAANYVSLKYGVLHMNVLPVSVQQACVVPEIAHTFALALGSCEMVAREIYLTMPGMFLPHDWHQDANETNIVYHFMVWVACTPCGVDAPGLSFAVGNPGRFLGGNAEAAKYSQAHPNIEPVMQPGDAIFFDTHSVHKTNVVARMDKSRIAFKFAAKALV